LKLYQQIYLGVSGRLIAPIYVLLILDFWISVLLNKTISMCCSLHEKYITIINMHFYQMYQNMLFIKTKIIVTYKNRIKKLLWECETRNGVFFLCGSKTGIEKSRFERILKKVEICWNNVKLDNDEILISNNDTHRNGVCTSDGIGSV
jgi:hypothetical protein